MALLTTITTDIVKNYLTDAELGSFLDEAEIQRHIRQVCDLVAAHVNNSGRYPRIPHGQCKVPDSLSGDACVIIRQRLISLIPGMADTLEGATRAKEYAAAIENLRSVARGELQVNNYADDPSVEPAVGTAVTGNPYQDWSRPL